MENYPSSDSEKVNVPETVYSKKFYEKLEQFEKLKQIANDENTPEEERAKAQADIEKYGELLEKSLDELDQKDKEERAKMVERAEAERLGEFAVGAGGNKDAGELGSTNEPGVIHVDSQGFVHSTSEDAQAAEPETRYNAGGGE